MVPDMPRTCHDAPAADPDFGDFGLHRDPRGSSEETIGN